MIPRRFEKIKKVLAKRQPDLTVILDNVHKPHNLAAIIRSCDAVGIGNIHGISSNKEKINVNMKSASGANNWIKLSIHNSIKLSISKLKKTNTKIFAANNSEKSIDFRDANFKEPCAIILGAELDGLSKEAINFTNQEIKIPMFGMVENLNVSVACAIILYEVQRQREIAGLYNKTRLSENDYKKLLFEFSYPKVAKIFNKKNQQYPDLDSTGKIIK